jgi:hypothetical protein
METYTIGQVLTTLPTRAAHKTINRNLFEDEYKDKLDAIPNQWIVIDTVDLTDIKIASPEYKKAIGKYYHRRKNWAETHTDYEFQCIRTETQFIMLGKRVINSVSI